MNDSAFLSTFWRKAIELEDASLSGWFDKSARKRSQDAQQSDHVILNRYSLVLHILELLKTQRWL